MELQTSVAEKNDTDLELAIKEVVERWPQAEILIFGAFGGRMDHHLASVFLPTDPEIAPPYVATLLDGPTKLSLLSSSRPPYHSAYSRLYLCSFLCQLRELPPRLKEPSIP